MFKVKSLRKKPNLKPIPIKHSPSPDKLIKLEQTYPEGCELEEEIKANEARESSKQVNSSPDKLILSPESTQIIYATHKLIL